MSDQEKQDKKIIVDDDWKQQAQKEKEVLAATEKIEKEEKADQPDQPKSQRGPLPDGNFAALISMLVTQAFFAMGLLKVDGQEEKKPDLELAKYHIDMLEILQKKTSGNLSEEEAKVLDDTLTQVRMAYVQAAE